MVAVCYAGGDDLGAALVRQGWALAYTACATDYVADEGAARQEGVGLWRGEFQPPWEWRRRQRTASTPSAPPGAYRIKGNINSEGERIYHVPGGQFYDRTRIDTTAGERWFCSEDEARAAGWQRSRR